MNYPQLVEPALLLNIRTAVNQLHLAQHNRKGISRQQILANLRWELIVLTNRTNALMEWTMPAKSRGSFKDNSGYSFAQITLSPEQKDQFDGWMDGQNKDIVVRISELALDGYKVSVSADLENQCFIASVTQKNVDHVHYSVTVTSRSDDWEEALDMCRYKVYSLYPGKPLPTERKKFNWG